MYETSPHVLAAQFASVSAAAVQKSPVNEDALMALQKAIAPEPPVE